MQEWGNLLLIRYYHYQACSGVTPPSSGIKRERDITTVNLARGCHTLFRLLKFLARPKDRWRRCAVAAPARANFLDMANTKCR